MYRDLLPIGSVVLLKGGKKRLMICGRVVCMESDQKIYDYVGCYYPQGVVGESGNFFFNQDAIETVFFIGFQDVEELNFRSEVLSRLDQGTPVVENGRITIRQRDDEIE